VRTDRNLLSRILGNLLDNAIKFTTVGQVTLRVKWSSTGFGLTGQLLAEVADSGPGISAEEGRRLFEKFEQAKAGRASRQGTGLGLAITRRVAEDHQGDIEVTSEPGLGAVFIFSLPAE